MLGPAPPPVPVPAGVAPRPIDRIAAWRATSPSDDAPLSGTNSPVPGWYCERHTKVASSSSSSSTTQRWYACHESTEHCESIVETGCSSW